MLKSVKKEDIVKNIIGLKERLVKHAIDAKLKIENVYSVKNK